MEDAAIREAFEETGLKIFDLEMVFEIVWKDRFQQTFVAKYSGEIHSDEPHVIKWLTKEELINGPFGEYNKLLFEKLGM